MHELQAITDAFEKSQQQGATTFLATIVNTFGSTYRQKGAKMLITEIGEMVGTLSGGCVENDIWQYTKQIQSKPLLINYDATSEEDLVWGFGLGCNGAVQILLEKLDSLNNLSPLNLIAQCLKNKKIGATATIFAVEGATDLKIGSRLLIYPDDKTYSDLQHRELEKAITNDTITTRNTRR